MTDLISPHLFSPLTLRGVTLPNRIGISPMCQYSAAEDGKPTDWHLAHLLQRAIGGAGLVMAEATAVVPEGRITPADLGLWEDAQIPAHARLAAAIAGVGAVPAIQIAHAGRKASRLQAWYDGPAEPGWQVVAPSAEAFGSFAVPRALSEDEILGTIAAFAATARRAVAAGYRVVELHAAHGYLCHQFLSPFSNKRNDRWGGDFAGRTRMLLETVHAVRAALPEEVPLMVRVSHTDWVEGGWDTAQTVELAKLMKAAGVDMVDVSSGGVHPGQKIPLGPGYQVPGAAAVREGAKMPVAAVGMITEPEQAQAILTEGKADVVLVAREVLRDPYWPMRAAVALGRAEAMSPPPQYDRAWSSLAKMKWRAETGTPLAPLG